MTVILLILVLLACWRLARLLTVDEIFRPARAWVVGKVGVESQVAYLVTCPWCISMYSSVPVVAAAVIWPTNRAVWAALLVLAGSGVAGIMQSVEDKLDR
jgi:hypothetical protein